MSYNLNNSNISITMPKYQWFVKYSQQPYIQQNKKRSAFGINYWLPDRQGF